MNASWFTFSFPDFSYAFLSILFEGVPFILLGTLLSGIIDEFLPARAMLRLMPRNVFFGICLSASLGVIFPMCECGIVPVIRRLLGKGLPLSNAIAYMLAAPVVNPIVALSTYAAFRGQNPMEMMVFRLGVAFIVSVIVGLAAHQLPIGAILKSSVAQELTGATVERNRSGTWAVRLGRALRIATSDFLTVMVYFVIGVAVSSCFSTGVNQENILPLALNDWLATFSLMGFATILSLCSTSDAFIAATLVTFPATAKLAFLVFGPMFDLKLIFIYGAVFRKRFVLGLGVGLFILIGLICVRLDILRL